jgi:heat shock protein HspQ
MLSQPMSSHHSQFFSLPDTSNDGRCRQDPWYHTLLEDQVSSHVLEVE